MSIGEHGSGVVRSRLLDLLVVFLFTVLCRHAHAAVALVQHTGRDAGTTTSSTLAFAANNSAGNFIAVAVRAGRTGQDVTVTDSRGNTYRRALQVNATLDPVTLAIYYAESIAAGANTVTVTDTLTGGSLRFAILEYSGVATSSALDGTPVMAEGTSTAMSSGTITTTAAGDLVLGLFSTAEAATFTAGAGTSIQERVPAAPGTKFAVQDLLQASAGPVAAQATIAAGQPWAAAVAAFRAGGNTPGPDLTVTKSHTGSFTHGQTGAIYALTARNVGTAATFGTVTVTDTLPAGLTATAFAGTGWSCTLSPLSCTRSDALGVGGSYPVLTLTVNVSASTPATVTNAASVSGGGQTNTGNDVATDPTTIVSTASQFGQWSAPQSWPIVAVHASLLPTGDVLAWTDYTTSSGAQIWRRATNTFTPKTYSPVSLFCAGHAYLPDGRLMVAGGIVGLQDDLGPRESTIFDPATESWSAGPLMLDGRYYPTTTTLPDGRILVAGGTTTCATCFADDIEIYDPAANSWTPLAASAQHTFKYYPHMYVLPDGRILAAAQDDRAIATEVLDLTSQSWTTIDSRLIDGHSSVMYLPGKVMKCGKAVADNPGLPSLATTFVLDMAQPSPAWVATASMASPRSHHNLTLLPDGQVLATGGGRTTDKADFPTAVFAAELWNPTARTWSTMASAQNPRLYHSTALLLPDATVLVAGGGRQNGRSQPDPKDQANAEIYSPPYLFRGPRPVITAAPGTVWYGASFQVTTPDAGRIGSVSLIPLGAVTHSFNETQRYVPLTFTAQAGAITVNGPASGNIAPPGPYMLFLVDTAGVPSVAAMVRVSAPLPVQQAGRDGGTTTSASLAFPSPNTAGNFIAVAIRAGRQGQSFTVTDTRNNTYRRALQVNETLDTVTLGIYYAENIAGGANTVTVSDTLTGGTLRFSIHEYAGIATSSALDGTPAMAEGTSAAPSSGSIATSTSGDLIFGMVSTSDSATYTAAGAGFTLEQQVPGTGPAKLSVVDRIQPAAGAIAATAAISPSQAWGAAVAAFRRGGGGPAPVPDLTISKSHTGSFTQGQTGATYAIAVSNTGTGPTSGTVSVVDALPSGLTATALSGTGWSCTLGALTCTRGDALAPAASYPVITLTVNVSASAPASVTNSVSVSGGGQTNTGNDTASDPTTITPSGPTPVPDLTISKSHTGSFTQGQTGATYTITVSNTGTASTSGTVSVVDTLPSGLTATALSGSGWSCTLGTLTCTRGSTLAPAASYPVITLTVNVSASAPASVTNSVSVSGGGQTNTGNDTASDPTTITPSGPTPVPDLTISKSHTGSLTQGQTGATYTIAVSNTGTGPTSGTVSVVDTLPSGLTATALSGAGWSCTLGTLTCTRSDALAAAASYPVITLTVNVSASAPASVTNSVSVSGGGQTNTGNDTASDPTTITPSGGGPATITLIQQAGRDAGTTTTSTLAFPSSNTAGNFIVVAIRAGRQGQAFTVTDTRGNTYQRALQSSLTLDTVTLGVYYAENIAGGANTVTVSDTLTGGTLRFAIFEYSGIATAGALDGTAALAEGTSGSASSGSITTLTGGDLIFGMVSTSDNGTYTAGSGFTLRQLVPAAGSTKLGVEDRTQATAGAIAATATISPSQAWGAAIVVFRAASAPGANAPKLVITSPTEGAAIPGSTLNVAYTETGDMTEVNHVHYQLDSGPVVMDLTLDGVFQFTGLHVGPHTLNGVLVRADHSTIAGSDAIPVHFTTVVDPADPVAPTVQITAPTGGTVSGIVTIEANANDNLGVYGVQFRVDGVNLGAEDLVAPYTSEWNTAVVTNGTHVLTAIARDAAGRETTSATVSVTVSNVSPTDPSVIGQFAGPFSWPLVSVHAILLPTGKVLLFDDHTTSAGVQVWNPATNTLTARPYNAKNLFCAGHTLLPDGRVLVVGGHSAAYVGIPDATLFDPVTETWAAAASMSQARWYPTATSLPDGRVLAVSGADNCPTCVDPNGSHQGIALVPEVYNPQTGAWSRLNGASLSLPLYPHMHVLPDGRVFAVATQEDPIVSRALDVGSQTWTTLDPVVRDGGSSVMYAPGKILKTGMGRNPDYAPVPSSSTAYVMDTTVPSPTWRAVANMSFARTQHNLVVLPDGKVLAVGGSTNSNVFDTAGCVMTAEMWSPVTETWTPMATMQEPRHYHSTALLLPDGRVLVAGGGRFGPDFPSAEIYAPPYLFRGARPAITSVAPTIQFNGHFTVGTPDGARVAKVTLVRLGAPTHAFDENQRYVELAFTPIASGLDVTGPTSPNVVLPGHYMLFLVDTAGVPSVGSIVRFPPPWEDTVAPTAPTGLAGTASPGKIDLTWSAASDNTGVALYNVHRGTVPGFVPTAANRVGQSATTTFQDTGFATGNYVYLVSAQDAAGNLGAPSNELTVFLQADVTSPSASVTAPTPGATVSGVLNVTASASDDIAVSGVQFLLDGGSLGVEDTTAPYGISWNSGTTPNGAHSISARARDAAGNATTSAAVACTVSNSAPTSLVAAYAFDEGSGNQSADATGQGHTLTVGGAAWTPSGKTGSALSFNGTSARSTIADANDLDLSSAMTLMAWVNPSVVPTGWRTILHKETDRYYLFAGSDGPGPAGGGTFGSGNANAFGPSALPAGAWTHLATTYDGSTVRIYVNATLVASAPATGGIGVSASPLSVGGTAAYGEFFGGRIDDVRIYSRALSQEEVEQDMAQPVVVP